MREKEGIALYGATDVGQVRTKNEDSIAYYSHPTEPFAYMVIADGMGGYVGGGMASQIAINEIEQQFSNLVSSEFFEYSLEQQESSVYSTAHEVMKASNKKIIDAKYENPDCSNMGTTAVLVVVLRRFLVVSHIGDSRAYLWTEKGLLQLTKDHSVVQEMIDAGVINEEEAKVSDVRNHITRALGVSTDIEAETHAYLLNTAALLMVCSDGVTEYLNNTDIDEALFNCSEIPDTCNEIIKKANDSGGKDNISIGLMRVNIDEITTPSTYTPAIKKEDSDVTIRRW